MKSQKHLLSMIPVGIFLIAALLGCSSAETDIPAATEQPAVDSAATTVESEQETAGSESPEEQNLNGYIYRIVAQHTDERPNFAFSETPTGEILNDSLIERNNAVEQCLNIKIEETVYDDRGKLRTEVTNSILAGDNAYDVIYTSLSDGIAQMAANMCLADLTTFPHLTLDSVLWNRSMTENCRIDGKQYFTTGVSSLSFLLSPMVFLFNQQLAADFDLPDLYQTVMDGKWTVEFMKTCMEDVAMDLNGDGVMKKKEDRYANMLDGITITALAAAAGLNTIYPDADGVWKLHLDEKEAVDFVDQIRATFYDPDKFYTVTNNKNQDEFIATFAEGRALFSSAQIHDIWFRFRPMKTDFGVLPIPVQNEGDTYATTNNTYIPSGIGVPITCPDPETTGLIMETYAACSHDIVHPAFMEKTLGKLSRDDASYKIMLSVYENSIYDLNTIMDFGGSAMLFRSSPFTKNADYISSYEKIKDKADAALQEFIEGIRNSEG